MIVRACRAAGFEPHLVSITHDQLAIRALIIRGLAVTLVPELLADPFHDLALRPIADSDIARDVYALLPPGRLHPPPPRHARRAGNDLDQPHPTPNRRTATTKRLPAPEATAPTRHAETTTSACSLIDHVRRPRNAAERRPGYAASTEHPASSPTTSDGPTNSDDAGARNAMTPRPRQPIRSSTARARPAPALIPGLPAGIIDPARAQLHRTADGGHRDERNVANALARRKAPQG